MPTGAQTASAMSLSVYNKPASLARPRTAKLHIGPWGPSTFDPAAAVAPVEGEPAKAPVEEAPEEEEAGRFPKWENAENLQMLPRTAAGQARLESMIEIQQIKDRLAKDGCPMNVKVLQTAIMIPDILECVPGEKKYP